MAHYYQKRWVFTWNSDEKGYLIEYLKLIKFLNEISKKGVFQKERGETTGRLHYQGRFELKGTRTGKKQLLKLFSKLYCVDNLTFEPERSKDSTEYCTKTITRVEGPWFVGSSSYRRNHTPMIIELKLWQKQLLNELKGPLGKTLRNRKVIWIQDPIGGSGKSTFVKYLRFGNSGLNVRKLPLDKPDRLRMVVCKISEEYDIDAFAFDFTRTLDEETSMKSLFQMVEEIKNGHVVSVMFGKPLEVMLDNPLVLIFTNEDISGYCHYLSFDRWHAYEIRNNELFTICKTNSYACHDMNTRYLSLDK